MTSLPHRHNPTSMARHPQLAVTRARSVFPRQACLNRVVLLHIEHRRPDGTGT